MLQKIIYLILSIVLWFFQIYGLSNVGLQEYDSVKNFFIVKDIANGNFTDMFQHGSPTFFLFFATIYKFFPSHLALEYTNALLNIGAIAIFTHIFAYHFTYKFWQKCFFLLYLGSSLYLVYGTRSFAIESMTLLFFAAMLWYYLRISYSPSKKTNDLVILWILTALILTINYKILLFFPVFFIIELYKYYAIEKTFSRLFTAKYMNSALVSLSFYPLTLAIPFFFYMILGVFLGVSWKSYPAHWFFVLIMRKNLNAWKSIGTLHFDIDYYYLYLQNFESPIIVFCYFSLIILLLLSTNNKFRHFFPFNIWNLQQTQILIILVFMVSFTLVEMSILPKAPRGILLILPILYFFAFEFINKILLLLSNLKFKNNSQETIYSKILFIGILIFLILYQYSQVEKHIYTYTSSNYPKISNYLQEKNITKLTVTVGINSKFFIPKEVELQTILFERDLINLKKQGYDYCLIDDYHKIVGANVFDSLRTLPTVFAVREPTLFSALLYLEHCEFTGYTYKEALAVRETLMKDSVNLRLIKYSNK
jgi:hypothetical protein